GRVFARYKSCNSRCRMQSSGVMANTEVLDGRTQPRLAMAIALAGALLFTSIGDADGTPQTEIVASGLSTPVFVTHAPDDDERLFIVELPGRIRIYTESSGVLATPFLDITGRVGSGGERGLLG